MCLTESPAFLLDCPVHIRPWHLMCHFAGNTRFHNFITDRDGTTNMYCGRYVTSIQAVYNAVWLATFSKQCCENSLFMTSAPLHGLKDVSIMPDGTFIHGCSKVFANKGK